MLNMNKKLKEKIIVILIIITIGIVPVAGWGDITHEAIDSQLENVPFQINFNPEYTNGGGVGPDMFYFLPGKEYYSGWAHTNRTADLPREMLNISQSGSEEAYSYGWLSHAASDIVGHKDYINMHPGQHTSVEIGVDANLVNIPDISFSVPYGLVQNSYENIYGKEPSYLTIFLATEYQAAAMYTERALIEAGVFNDLKEKYNDFWSIYKKSIDYSENVINNPSRLPNTNLNAIGESDHDISTKIRDTAIELIRKNVIVVPIIEDKNKKIIHVGEPVVINRKIFDDTILQFNKVRSPPPSGGGD